MNPVWNQSEMNVVFASVNTVKTPASAERAVAHSAAEAENVAWKGSSMAFFFLARLLVAPKKGFADDAIICRRGGECTAANKHTGTCA